MTQSLTDVIAEAIKTSQVDPETKNTDDIYGILTGYYSDTTMTNEEVVLYAKAIISCCSKNVLQAIDQAGYVAVPKEPSDKQIDAMVKAFTNPRDIYAAMLSALKEG